MSNHPPTACKQARAYLNRRIYKVTANKDFSLYDKDLADLHHEEKTNTHHR